jgi:hypothetical protein
MSLDHYDRFLKQCNPSGREHEILKNGLIVRRPKDGHSERRIEIHCKLQDAQLLLALATQVYPDAVPAIKKGIAPSHWS